MNIACFLSDPESRFSMTWKQRGRVWEEGEDQREGQGTGENNRVLNKIEVHGIHVCHVMHDKIIMKPIILYNKYTLIISK